MTSIIVDQTYPSDFRHGTVDEPYQVFIKIFLNQLCHQGSRRRGGLGGFDSDCIASSDSSRL